MMGHHETVTAKELADVLGKTIRLIQRRAKNERWPAEILNNRGDRRFILAGLPEDVRMAVLFRKQERGIRKEELGKRKEESVYIRLQMVCQIMHWLKKG